MRVINIIEIVDNNVQGIESYPIFEEQLSDEVVEKAEEDFTAKAIENGANQDDMGIYLEDGYFRNDNYAVNLVWSYVS